MNDTQATLDYFVERHCAPQWRVFVGELVAEFHRQVDPDLAAGFFRQLGRRMARTLPLPKCETLEGLEAAINATLSEIDWGWVRLTMGERFLEVTHGAYPVVPITDVPAGDWLAPVLEGLYGEWLAGLSGDASLRAMTASLPGAPGEPIGLHYGRHD